MNRMKVSGVRARRRNEAGATLMEMCIATSIMALISTAAFSLLISVSGDSRKLENQTSGVQAARITLDRIGSDIRMARALGDVFGAGAINRGDLDNDGEDESTVEGSDEFPSAHNVIVPSGYTWPTWADNTAPNKFKLSGQTLVVQIPIFDADGFPSGVTIGGKSYSNVETHIYRVLKRPADPANVYTLQYLCVPGEAAPGYDPDEHKIGPATLVTGIVGPFPKTGANGPPQIFQYINRWNPSVSHDSIPAADAKWIADYTTVGLNLEIRKQENSAKSAVWAVKQDVSIRNNAQATDVGVTNTP